MRNALAHAGRSGRRVVSAFIATAFAQDDAEQARAQWRRVADQLRPKLPKLAALIDHAEPDVLAYMSFPAQHRVKLHSTNPLERLNGEIKRRTEVVGIFRLVGFVTLLNDEREKLRVISPQATAARQVSVAAARKPRCVDADVR
jgi:putative transposase